MANYTIVTGASMGVGRALAGECARKNRNLILVSLPGEELREVAEELAGRYGIRAEYYETDLTEEGEVDRFYGWCREREFSIDMLINNAGMGSQGKFEFLPDRELLEMMNINMNALASMCRSGLPFLKEQERSYILNVGSLGAFTPVPYKTVYSATKHFVLAFSEALYFELKETPVFVGCLCPGPIITSERQREKVKDLGLRARMLTKNVDEVARSAIEGVLDRQRVIIPGVGNKVIAMLSRVLPTGWRLKLAASVFSGSSFN